MKNIIVLKGKSNTGKTETIKGALKQIFGIEVYKPKKDIVLSFKHKNKVIAIITIGDYLSIIEYYFDKIKDEFDILICSCRTQGKTYDFFNNLDKEKYSVKFIDKIKNNEKEVVSEIKDIISKLEE